jgi:hypothetical protein
MQQALSQYPSEALSLDSLSLDDGQCPGKPFAKDVFWGVRMACCVMVGGSLAAASFCIQDHFTAPRSPSLYYHLLAFTWRM